MDAFDVNGQWFELNTNRDSLRPNSLKMKIYQQADDKPAMLNDDLEKEREKKSIPFDFFGSNTSLLSKVLLLFFFGFFFFFRIFNG